MLCEVPLTKEQQTFATAHHSLVYKFLNENRLPEDEFYDVVIFGYLKAVRDYFSDLTAQQFTFSTIGYDYDKAVERCKKKRARKSHSNDVGEDALLLTVRAAGKSADNEKEAAPYEEDTPWEPELE